MNELNLPKFKQMLHYIISKCGSFDNVGKTVLFKIAYFSDFDYYELYEHSITNEIYIKLPRGPAPINFDKAIVELKKDGKIKQIFGKYFGKSQKKFISLEEGSYDLLSGNELKVIDNAISKISSQNATQASAYSHEDMPWQAAKENEVLKYELVFYRNKLTSVREYSEDDSI